MGKTGLQAAIDDLGGLGDPAADLQPELFEAGDLPMPVTPIERKSGPQGGRPKGARNRSTEEWRQYALSRYRSPMIMLFEIVSRTPQSLARELGLWVRIPVGEGQYADRLDTAEAFRRQMEAMSLLMPYVHQKQPLAVEARGDAALGVLMIGDLGSAFAGDGLPPAAPEQMQQDQGVIEADVVRLEGDQSDEYKTGR